MRKNYFAKKFVAYSMAFAVAFSTLTVSPVFVKDAKAVTGPTNESGTVTIADGQFLISSKVTSSLGTSSTATVDKGDIVDLISGATDDNSKVLSITDEEKTVAVTGTPANTLYKYNRLTFAGNSLDGQGSDALSTTAVPVVFDSDGDFSTGTTYSAVTAWYKLDLIPVEITRSTGNTTTPTETLTCKAYEATQVKNNGVNVVGDLSFNKSTMTNNKYGLYIGKTAGAPVIINLVKTSGLKASYERETFTAATGKNATLVVHATNDSKSGITYKWRYGQTTLSSTTNECTIENVDGTKTGRYVCTVSDGIGEVVLPMQLDVATVVENQPKYTTVVEALNEAPVPPASTPAVNTLIGGKVALTSSVPENDNYRYVWLSVNDVDNPTTATKLAVSEADGLKYDAVNNSFVITDKNSAYNTQKVVCYTLTKEDYESLHKSTVDSDKKISKKLEELKEAQTDVSKNTIKGLIRDIEAATITDIDSKALFIEEFKLVNTDDSARIKSVNLAKNIGESVTLSAPVAKKLCAGDTVANATDRVISSITAQDFGSIELTSRVTCAGNADPVVASGTHTKNYTTYYNIIYKSDLKAEAVKDTISAKVGAKNIELEANASSDAGVTYQWEKVVAGTPSNVGKDSKTYTIDTVATSDIYVPAVKNELGAIVTSDSNYYTCTVSNGIEKVTLKFTLTQEGGYKVYATKPIEGSTVATALNDNATKGSLPASAIPGKELELSPYVVAADGVNITYKWYNTSDIKTILSETDTLKVAYKEPTSYVCVISDGTDEFKLTYNVTDNTTINKNNVVLVFASDIEDQTYTGKEITPELDVRIFDDKGTQTTNDDVILGSKLVAGTDYTVEFVENVNVGVARVKVTPTGLYKGNTVEKIFYINRADNTLEIADKTAVLGGSVQPKTVKNTAKATLSYAYFTDAECANEIEVPSKVGTYYVKATSAATLNYKEATSNVATVKVVPGKVKMLGTSRTASSVKLNWNKATGATSYRVYYKAPGAKSYKVFKNTTATSMNVTGLASATTYTFAVKAYAKTAGYSTVYATKITTTAPAKVSTPSVTAGSKKATVKFTKVARATGYQIYMAKGNGKYVKVKTTTSTSFTKTGLAKGATYKFKVRAYKTVGSNTYYGAFSSAKAVKVK